LAKALNDAIQKPDGRMTRGMSNHLMSAAERDEFAEIFANLVVGAGPVVMDAYTQGCRIWKKSDRSPVSEADERVEHILCEGIARNFPGIPVVAEEAVSRGNYPAVYDHFLLVDPLDGTREFIARNGEFTINIALIAAAQPVAGAVFAPALAKLWFAGNSAYYCSVSGGNLPSLSARRLIRTRPAPASGLVAMKSRSHGDRHTEALLARLPIRQRIVAGSSIKFCALAEGSADLYARFSPTMEWDTAAGDAILRAAGGVMYNWDGSPFRYGKTGYRNGGFMAWADATKANCTQGETVS
jgi:3'(2'),5'-bisphosphate nucleotidase